MKSSLMQLSKFYKFAWQGSKVAPDSLKNSIIEKRHLGFFLIYTKKFTPDLNIEKIWFWDSRGFTKYVQFSSFLGILDTTAW